MDTTGELRNLYARASAIFIGKSLMARGGQNIIEPAAYGKPIVVGPHTENFASVMDDFRKAEAIIEVADAAALQKALAGLLDDEAARRRYGENARRLLEAKRGTVAATVRLVAAEMESVSCASMG
jgi:3-deoxy-D-manno-octulosonic-acid transferase